MSDTRQRERLIEILGELGVAAHDVPDNPADAAAMASDVVFARDDRYSLRTLAAAAGHDPDEIGTYFTHLGIQIDDPDEVIFNDDDVALARFLYDSVETILTPEEGIEILHVAATALNMLAEAAVAGHVQGPERRTVDMVDNALLNARIAELGLALSTQLATPFRHHLRQAAIVNRRTQNFTHRELVTLSIGFLDLVGFTSLSQSMSPGELVGLVKGFEDQAHELAHRHRARIVKLIGDAVMLVAEHPTDAAAFVIGMIDSFDGPTGQVVPRGGLAHGDLVNIHGDYFGPVVNLAARLVDSAVPGEVLVDDTMAASVETEPAGRRML